MRNIPRIERPIVIAAFVGAALLGWAIFHPELRADPAAISPSVKAEIAKAGFKSTSSVTATRFENIRSVDEIAETLDHKQEITRIDDLLTEKRSRRYAKFYFEENVGLYVGPLTVLRHTRSVLPMVASLLPWQFWASTRMSDFAVQHVDSNFPRATGSKLVATVTFEDRHADGELALTERVQLRCEVREVVGAHSIAPNLPGLASVISCEEMPEPNGRVVAAKGRDSLLIENVKYSHLYVGDVGWSIPVEGERTVRVEGITAKETWKSKLKSFTVSASALASSK